MTGANVSGFEPVARGLYLEGLAVDTARGVVWYSDVIAGGVHGLWPDGRIQTFNPERMWTGGVLVNEDGAVLSSGPGGIMWNHPETGKSGWLLSEIDGVAINGVNEMIPDGTGGIFFGTSDIENVIAGQATRTTAVYRLTTDLQVIRVSEDINFTNGLMLSADRKLFFCNDTFVATYVFDVQPDLTLGNKRVLLDKEDADGMALDAEGALWVTGFRSSEIVRVRPDGSILEALATPAGAITQVRFGGPDLRDVYINSVPADGGDGLAVGELPTEQRSIMYRARSETPGQAIAPTHFRLG